MRQTTVLSRSTSKKSTLISKDNLDLQTSKIEVMTAGFGGDVNHSSSGTLSRADLENTMTDLPIISSNAPKS
jgi:hypothetical protein